MTQEEERYLSYIKSFTRDWNQLMSDYRSLRDRCKMLEKRIKEIETRYEGQPRKENGQFNFGKKSVDNSGESDIIDLSDREISFPHQKFVEYALDPIKQPDKARAFKEALGYTKKNYRDLIDNISKNLDRTAFKYKGNNKFGDKYENIIKLTGPNGKQANVCTAWILKNGTDSVCLTSVYVTKKKVLNSD